MCHFCWSHSLVALPTGRGKLPSRLCPSWVPPVACEQNLLFQGASLAAFPCLSCDCSAVDWSYCSEDSLGGEMSPVRMSLRARHHVSHPPYSAAFDTSVGSFRITRFVWTNFYLFQDTFFPLYSLKLLHGKELWKGWRLEKPIWENDALISKKNKLLTSRRCPRADTRRFKPVSSGISGALKSALPWLTHLDN